MTNKNSNSNLLTVFTNEEFGEIRVTTKDNEPWFVLADVCKILGTTNPTMALDGLEDFEKAKLNLGLRGGATNCISESGFYTLVLRSRKPVAKPFRLWVTQEVLPQIRKTGGYIPVEKDEPREVVLARAVKVADETIKEQASIIVAKDKRIKALEETEKDWKLLMDTKGTFSINDVAHTIGIGEYTLFALLRDMKILFRNIDGDTIPYENSVNKTKFTTCPAIAPNGVSHLQTRVLPSGIPYITKRLRKAGYLAA